MKVAFFFGAINRGGAESLVHDVCARKDRAPFEIVCLYRKDGEYLDSFRETGVKMLKVGQKGESFIHFLLHFRKVIRRNQIEIVHAQTGFNALICLVSLAFTPVKLITSFHGFSFSSAPFWQRKLVYGFSKRIICVSEFEKQYYQEKWNLPVSNKLRVLYNGIDFSKIDTSIPDSDSPVCFDKDCLNMAMVGSFKSGRSQSFVCKVADELNKKAVCFNLFFIGRRESSEPRRYDSCVEYCVSHGLSERVHFLGNRSDVPYLLSQMDLFVYASEHDTFGIAVLEALASAIPVIVNDWVVMKEITNKGEYACLYETDNVDDCLSKILAFRRRWIDDPEMIRDDSLRIAKEVREKYSIDNHIQGLYDIYLSCL